MPKPTPPSGKPKRPRSSIIEHDDEWMVRWSRRIRAIAIIALLGAATVAWKAVRPGLTDEQAAERALENELEFIRAQLGLYAEQHSDVSPGYPRGQAKRRPTENVFVAQLTRPTSAQGDVGQARDAEHPFGPYLRSVPANPVTGQNGVLIISQGEGMPILPGLISANDGFGWVYHAPSRTFKALRDGSSPHGDVYFPY